MNKPTPLHQKMSSNILITYLRNLNERRKKEIVYFKRLKKLQQIIKTQALNTFFQPIINLSSGKTVGYEALNRPVATSLFPNTEFFYDFVGQSNHVFLFECLCRNLSLKRFMERSSDKSFSCPPLLFINIHPNVLLDANYHSGETLQLLSELGIDTKQVVFELTEKSAVKDFTLFEKVLSHYRNQGYRIAIDDVGSGYNSLKTLIYLKPEFIKLDKSLTQNINENEEQKQIIKLIMEYAKHSSTKVIAEGIEKKEDLIYLRNRGIDYGQGYAIGKPSEKIREGLFDNELIDI